MQLPCPSQMPGLGAVIHNPQEEPRGLGIAFTHCPPEQLPPSQHGPQMLPGAFGTQVLVMHVSHVPQLCVVPVVLGFPPQCHPPFTIPTPGSDLITLPSLLTVPVPIAMKLPRS